MFQLVIHGWVSPFWVTHPGEGESLFPEVTHLSPGQLAPFGDFSGDLICPQFEVRQWQVTGAMVTFPDGSCGLKHGQTCLVCDITMM